MFLHIMVVVVLEIGEGTKVDQYEYRNYLGVRQGCFAIPLRLAFTLAETLYVGVKFNTEIIYWNENIYNFIPQHKGVF